MAEIDLGERFPDMKPMRSAPGMWRVNGFGTAVYGRRDHDPETGTYVKTYCVSALWVPVLALSAYRVADADKGWYFVGRVPLSPFAKLWNVLVLVAAASMAGRAAWASHTNSPEYRAREQLEKADEQVAAGELVHAARAYAALANGTTATAADARAALRGLLDGPLARAPLADVAAVFRIVAKLRGQPLVPDLLERARALVDARGTDDPEGALALLDAVAAPPADPRRLPLLEQRVARAPDDLDAVFALAAGLDSRGETERCRELLEARRDRLGHGDGARILGRIYARTDRLEEALALLEPYSREGLARLHAAEERYNQAAQRAWDRALNALDQGRGPDSFYRRYEAADEDGQRALLQEYLGGKVREDAAVKAAAADLERDSPVVSVALDLGLIHLRRAQESAAPDARRAELEEAEKAFLAIRGLAGETEDYKLSLGQVYYWSGRAEEGKQLFEELLAAADRRPDLLVAVAGALRDVGAQSEARTLAEEAWGAAEDPAVRYTAAQMRALTPLDNDDELTWLGRCDGSQPHVRAMLNTAQGDRAARAGHWNDAARYFRAAIDAYEAMPESGATLNNRALACLNLYECTGERADFRKGVASMRASLRLQPGSGVALGNAASLLIEDAVLELVSGELDLARLRIRGAVEYLRCLAPDATASRDVTRRFREHASLREARRQIDLAHQLAPRGTLAPELALTVLVQTRGLADLQALAARVQAAEFDLTDEARVAQERYRGRDLARAKEARLTALKTMAEVAGSLENEPANRTFQLAAVLWTAQARAALEEGEQPEANGAPVAPEAVTRWIERAHEAAPTEATYRTLAAVLVTRAAQALVAKDAEFAALWNETRRAAGSDNLVAYALARPGPWRDALQADPDLTRAAELTAACVARFPESAAPWDWALLRAKQPDAAKKVAARLTADGFQRLVVETAIRLSPYSGARAFGVYWLRLAAGDEEGAKRALADCIAQGTPLPGE